MLRRSSWLEITQGMSQSSSSVCQRCSRSARQWDSRLAISTTRFFCAESVMCHAMENSSAIGAKASRKASRPNGKDSARISWRMKNQPLCSSEWWLASVIQPLYRARKLLTFATMPTRSGQAIVRR